MGSPIPQVITQDRASGSQPSGGSLCFKQDFRYLNKTFAAAGNRKTWTCSYWCKLTGIGQTRHILGAWIDTNNRDNLYYGTGNLYHYNMKLSSSWHVDCDTDALYRDVGWYHFCHVWDTTQSSSGDRVNTYVNGVNQTFGGSATSPSQNADSILMAACAHYIGAGPENDGSLQASSYYEGYLSQFYFIDGQALEATDFGYTDPLTGIWRPKKYVNTLGKSWPNDQGDIWSAVFTSSGTSMSTTYPAVNVFDGNISSIGGNASNDSSNALAFAPAFQFTGVQKLRVRKDYVYSQIEIRIKADSSWGSWFDTPSSSNADWVDLTSEVSGGKVNGIEWRMKSGISNAIYLAAIEINGIILVDGGGYGRNGYYLPFDGEAAIGKDKSGRENDWQFAKVKGQTSLNQATGAFPILNTTSAGAFGSSGARPDYVPNVTPTAIEGCVAYNGSGNLSLQTSSDLAFGTGDFTIEFWTYMKSDAVVVFFDMRPNPASTQGLYPVIYGGGGNGFTYFVDSSARITGSTPTLGAWYHIALARSGTSTKLFVNGVQSGSTYSDSNNYLNGDTTIGSNSDNNSNHLNGFISNVRVLKGTALYTSDFEVPISPLTNITNTKLLCCQSSRTSTAALVSPSTYGTGWSGYITGGLIPGSADQYVPSNCFDGDVTTTHVRHNSTVGERGYAGWYFQPPTGIEYTSLEIHTGVSGVGTQEYILNGGTATGFAENSWVQIDGSAGTLTSLQITPGSTGNANIYLGGIRINGSTILTDPIYNHGSATARCAPALSEASGSCILALPLIDNSAGSGAATEDVSNQINPESPTKTAAVWGATSAAEEGGFYNNSYYFDGTNDEIITSHATAFDVENSDFTAECWWNIDTYSGNRRVFTSGNGSSSSHKSHFQLVVTSSGLIRFDYDATAGHSLSSPTDIVNSDTWNHTAIQRNSTSGTQTMEIYHNGTRVASTTSNASFDMNNTEGVTLGRESTGSSWWKGWISDFRFYNGVAKYQKDFIPGTFGRQTTVIGPSITRDCPSGEASFAFPNPVGGAVMFNDQAGSYLSMSTDDDLEFGTGDFSIECWFMTNQLGEQQHIYEGRKTGNTNRVLMYIKTDNKLWFYGNAADRISSQVLQKDVWYHTAACRCDGVTTLYLNGVSQGTYADTNDYDKPGGTFYIGIDDTPSGSNYGGFISNMRVLKGRAAYIAPFLPPTKPLESIDDTVLLCCQSSEYPTAAAVIPTGSITANGISANASRFTPFGDVDLRKAGKIVRGRSANYPTLNPLKVVENCTFSDGDLRMVTGTSSNSAQPVLATMVIPKGSGKYYWEVRTTEMADNAYGRVGLAAADTDYYVAQLGNTLGQVAFRFEVGDIRQNLRQLADGLAASEGDTLGIAYDALNSIFTVYINGVLGVSATISEYDYIPAFSDDYNGYSATYDVNFGQYPFQFPPPKEYQPLNSVTMANAASSIVATPKRYFDVAEPWTGTGGTKAITGFQFKPDLVWIKQTSNGVKNRVYDTIRGVDSALISDEIDDPDQYAAYGQLDSFNQDGFTVASGSGDAAGTNESGETIVAWCWKGGGSGGTFNIDDKVYASAATAGLGDGHISPTACSINTKAGFSILKWTGNQGNAQNMAHGLGALPDFVICKNLGTNYNWFIYHSSAMTNGQNAALYFTDAALTTGFGTQPFGTFTTQYLNFGNNDGVNGAYDYIGYAWKNIPGLQKFGKYTGNNDADGPFIYLGFKPALVVIKRTDTANNWNVQDYRRTSYNGEGTTSLQWDTASSQATIGSGYQRDICANGFKIRNNGTETNGSAGTYIYMAWAEEAAYNLYGATATSRGEV